MFSGSLSCLPLYEGVDWNIIVNWYHDSAFGVSLFTREWIEIKFCFCLARRLHCLPLYEGVDWNIFLHPPISFSEQSPSLRGSGLKLPLATTLTHSGRSPSLRGSGLKSHMISGYIKRCCLPLYEGVDWNRFWQSPWSFRFWSPSLRGSGLKSKYDKNGKLVKNVSLFTREWIEIQNARITQHPRFKSPSLRGSGLKYAVKKMKSNP